LVSVACEKFFWQQPPGATGVLEYTVFFPHELKSKRTQRTNKKYPSGKDIKNFKKAQSLRIFFSNFLE